MQITSQVIPLIGQINGTGIPGPLDSQLVFRQDIQPVIEAPLPMMMSVATGQQPNTSFSRTFAQTATNTGGIGVTHVILSAGLWRLTLNVWFEFNFANASPVALDGNVRLVDPNTGQFLELCSQSARIGWMVWPVPPRDYLLDRAMALQTVILANGAGQTTNIILNVHANRLY